MTDMPPTGDRPEPEAPEAPRAGRARAADGTPGPIGRTAGQRRAVGAAVDLRRGRAGCACLRSRPLDHRPRRPPPWPPRRPWLQRPRRHHPRRRPSPGGRPAARSGCLAATSDCPAEDAGGAWRPGPLLRRHRDARGGAAHRRHPARHHRRLHLRHRRRVRARPELRRSDPFQRGHAGRDRRWPGWPDRQLPVLLPVVAQCRQGDARPARLPDAGRQRLRRRHA